MIVSYTPDEILFASDTFRYYLKSDTVKAVLEHTLEINHKNFKEHIEKIEFNKPKIHKITRNTGLIAGGDGRLNDVIQNLNKRKNIPKQIMERLEQYDHEAFWSCHVATVRKGKVQLTSIFYKNGKITTKQHIKDNISLDSFAPEMKDIFFKKYVMQFYISNTQEKIKILNEFFNEITELFNKLAGGNPKIAKIDSEGFKWIS